MTRAYPRIGISDAIFQLITDPERQWSDEDAMHCFEWVTNSISDRIEALLKYLDIADDSMNDNALLLQVGKSVAEILPDSQFSTEPRNNIFRIQGKKTLTSTGKLLGIDIGLLTANLLQNLSADLFWDINYEDEIDISFRHPVLAGFRTGEMYDPLVNPLTFTMRVLNKERPSDSWALSYQDWKRYI